MGNSGNETRQLMLLFLRFFNVVAESVGDNLPLIGHVIVENFKQTHLFGLAVGYGNHINAIADLHIGIFKQTVQHFLRICAFF